MKASFHELYEKLLTGIADIEKDHPDLKEQIEMCFHLCERIRRQVDEMLQSTRFESEEEEIFFLKTVKPPFTTLVEFYSILYRAELFIPDLPSEQHEFWNYEMQRARLFLDRHDEFFRYLKSGDTSHDRRYFLRKDATDSAVEYEELIAKLFAREKYVGYITNKLLPPLANVNP
jgi:hypothetical protein